MAAFTHIALLHRHNKATLLSSPIAEISGALGDLGTLLPLMIALAAQGSISLSSTLVLSGLYNILTGIIFGIPLPVQPMKAIAAAAIASHAPLRTTIAAGALVSAAVLLLSATGLLRLLVRYVPVPVVKGIQLGAGLSLVISAGTTLLRPLRWVQPALDNRLWALLAFTALILIQRTRRVPYALIMFLLGILLAVATLATTTSTHGGGGAKGWPVFSPWHPHGVVPDFGHADAWSMAIAQLPLTTLNSVVAAAALAAELFPDLPGGATTPGVTALGISVGVMNLAGCWVGAMPVCHGAGGLAAQYRFGARSGSSIVMLGLLKLIVGLLFGGSLVGLLKGFPAAILGVMVIAAGLELAMVGQSLNHGAADLWEAAVEEEEEEEEDVAIRGTRGKRHREISDEERKERWVVMLMTTAGILAFKNDAVGFIAGMLCFGAYRLADWVERRQERRGGFVGGEHEPLLH